MALTRVSGVLHVVHPEPSGPSSLYHSSPFQLAARSRPTGFFTPPVALFPVLVSVTRSTNGDLCQELPECADAPLLRIDALRTPHVGPVSLTVSARQRIVICGPSGSGKTLFLRALADLDPNEGEVYLSGKRRDYYPPAQWRKQVGMLPAEACWWAETVGEHFPVQDRSLLSALGFALDVMRWPVTRLSSGERQRLALLRLLANQPRVLLLDEPTANLDPGNTRRVESAVRAYMTEIGACVLWVAHDQGQIERIADRVVRFVEGHLRAEPAP